jgi:hypothetical protein
LQHFFATFLQRGLQPDVLLLIACWVKNPAHYAKGFHLTRNKEEGFFAVLELELFTQ